MSKLAFILCVVLFASAANASHWSDAVEAAQKKVEAIIDAAITTILKELEAAKQKSFEIAEKIEAAAEKFVQKVINDVTTILEKTQDEIDKLTGAADGVNITECTQMAAQLEQTALNAISNMSVCISDKVALGSEYIANMVNISNELIGDLKDLRDKARQCGENVDSITSSIKAIACINLVGVNATWTAAKAVPAFSANVAKLSYLLTTLPPSLTYCFTTSGIATFYHESSTIVDRTKKCIQQKMDEFRDGEPGAHTTVNTEEPLISSTHGYSTKAPLVSSTHDYSTEAPLVSSTHDYSTEEPFISSTHDYSTEEPLISSTYDYSTEESESTIEA